MRVSLLNEGTYPVYPGGVSAWCHDLVSRAAARFDIITLVGRQQPLHHALPPAVLHHQQVELWAPVLHRSRHRSRTGRELQHLVRRWCAELFPPGWHDDPTAGHLNPETVLELLTRLGEPRLHPLSSYVGGRSTMEALMAAPGWPALPLRDTAEIATQVDRLLWALDHQLYPQVGESDVVHATCNGIAGIVAASLSQAHHKPFILTEHGLYMRERYLGYDPTRQSAAAHRVMMHVWAALARCTYHAATLTTSVASMQWPWLQAYGAEPATYRTIHNGIDPAAFPPLPFPEGPPTAVWVGKVGEMKDLHTLLEAMLVVHQRLPEARLNIVGPENSEPHYARGVRARVQALGLSEVVHHLGPVSTSAEAFAAGSVAVSSSLSEGLPFTVIEAMMCGRPVVSTDVGGVHEIVGVDGAAGLLVPPRDPTALGEALVSVLSQPHQSRSMGQAARARVQHAFSLERSIRAYEQGYRDALHWHRESASPSPAPPGVSCAA